MRFSEDVWQELEAEASALGISAAQYVREATVARMAYVAGLRGDGGRARALRAAGAATELEDVRDDELRDRRLGKQSEARGA